MNARIASWLQLIITLLTLSTAVVVPLFFLNLTSEFYETPKLIALVVITGTLWVLWALKCLLIGRTTITRTPLDLPLILLLIIFTISTFFASSRSVAILGNLPRFHGGLAAFTAYTLFYFILTTNLKKGRISNGFIHLLLGSGTILAILSILSFLGRGIIPMAWTSYLSFTPTGSNFSTTAILALLLPFPLVTILKNNLSINIKKPQNSLFSKTSLHILLALILISLFAVTIALTGTLATFIAALAALALTLFTVPSASIKKNLLILVLPAALTIFVSVATFTPLMGRNILYRHSQMFIRETQLPLDMSWKTSISAFRDSPFWGTGPASYLFNFTAYKPAEFNSSTFWTLKFDQAFNEYLHSLAVLGALGFIALILLTAIYISLALKALASAENNQVISLAMSGLIFFIILSLHTSTMPLWVIGMIILALFVTNYKEVSKQATFSTFQITATEVSPKKFQLQFEGFSSTIIVITLILVGVAFYFTGKLALADYQHRIALNAIDQGQITQAYKALVLAEKLNPQADIYRINLAQTNFALANSIASAKGPTESSPSGSLTEADKQSIQTFLSQAITESRVATAISPKNSAHWEVLGSIYHQISGVAQNALSFALDSYGRAIQLDPLNPSLRLTVGSIYYSAKSYDLAIRFFTDAINLKPDFVNAYYNLAIALRDKGDLKTAQAIAEKMMSLIDPKHSDYQKAADLLASLKPNSASDPAKITLQEGESTSSALKNKKLPKVLNLSKTDKISTPPAVKR